VSAGQKIDPLDREGRSLFQPPFTARRGHSGARRRHEDFYGRATPFLRHPRGGAFSSCLSRDSHPDCRAAARLDRTIAKLAQKDETARRLMSIPGFGPITASAMAATIQDTSSFAGPREFAAFLGLTPKQNSSGGKPKLGRISKMGNRNLRKLLVVGAHAVLFHRKPHTDPLRMWAMKLIEKKPFKLVAVALANKMARIAFAILRSKTVYREIPA
jgi:transposase